MMRKEHAALLRGFVAGRVEGRDVANFADELAAARASLTIIPDLDGMAVSKALRAAGFNRAYDVSGRPSRIIVYRRNVK